MAPIERDPSRDGEPFLRFAPPYSQFILTPPRESDKFVWAAHMNTLEITKYLSGPPFPYTVRDAEEFYPIAAKSCADALAQYKEVAAGNNTAWLESPPVRYIREVDASTGSSSAALGDIRIQRCGFAEILDKDERKRAKEANNALEAGDPRIVWEIGNHLFASHHGRGIMTAAIKAMIDDIAVPLMNAHIIQIHYFSENVASGRVFEKNGFVDYQFVPDALTLPESKGGNTVSYQVMRWYRPGKV